MKNKRLEFSLFVAFFGTLARVLFKKIGGQLSGGIYSDSHSWSEIVDMIPEFILFFFILFIFAYVIFYRKT
ncbi:MAG: hypothetical protein GY705_22950 [Bacteroidetes bacterium]|nr:hypothetical protein [Bacteroidota bacterium]